MDDWNDFGGLTVRPPLPPPYSSDSSSSSSTASVSNSSIAQIDDTTRESDPYTAPTDNSDHDVTRDRGSILGSLPFLKNRSDSSAPSDSITPAAPSLMRDRDTDAIAHDMSQPSENEDDTEPASRMMPRTHAADEDEDFEEFPVRKGDLDDVPNDYEMNIEGYCMVARTPRSGSSFGEPQSSIVTSSLLRPVEKTYVKMEVISSKEIRHWVCVFNLFVFIATVFTLAYVILANTKFRAGLQLVHPPSLLSEEQKSLYSLRFEAVPPNWYRRLGIPQPTPRPTRNAVPTGRSIIHSIHNSTMQTPNQLSNRSTSQEVTLPTHLDPDMIEYFTRKYQCQGVDVTSSGIMQMEPPADCAATYTQRTPQNPTPQIPSPQTPTAAYNFFYKRTTNRVLLAPSPPPFTEPFSGVPFFVVYYWPAEAALPLKKFKYVSHIISAFIAFFFVLLTIIYAIRVINLGRTKITHEQIWMLILLIASIFYFNPVESVFNIIALSGAKGIGRVPQWVRRMSNFFLVMGKIGFATASYFYLWMSLHTYRVLDPGAKLSFRVHYLPKIIILLPYFVFIPILHYTVRSRFSEVPLLAAPAMAYIYSDYQVFKYLKTEMILAIVRSLYDLMLTLIILYEGFKTMRLLNDLPYMKYRTKRVGFRYFMYTNFVFYVLFIILYSVLLFGSPKGGNLLYIEYLFDLLRTDLHDEWRTGPLILFAGYLYCLAHFHLPYDATHWFWGWFYSQIDYKKLKQETAERRSAKADSREAPSPNTWTTDMHKGEDDEGSDSRDHAGSGPTSGSSSLWTRLKTGFWSASNDDDTLRTLVDDDEELQKQIIDPITYRKEESKDSLELKANCFTMQTHVILFNFAWYVYYYGTPKLENFRPKKNPLPFNYRIAEYINSKETDTQALVVDCSDRIIVTFKGTTTMRNLRTSLRMSQTWLTDVIRHNADGVDEGERLRRLFRYNYYRGKIHRGFAEAYLSVARQVTEEVRKLRRQNKRPVFLTGHSLGGALATICSLDLWVKLDISRREIFVSTFGSPRVGNIYFATMYGDVVPLHWRIVVDPDMIAKLPSVGYSHVGRKVVLTPHGEMIIDPSDLERRPWSGEAAGFAYHRKASYLLAMRAWCVRNHGMTYTPIFWPFPVRPEDERRFAGAFDDDQDTRRGRRVAAKIMHMDAMVDALDRGDTELANMAVVEKWERLARRVLLNDKLMGKRE